MATLKCHEGLIQLEKCPICEYLVKWTDMMYQDEQPVQCKWCKNTLDWMEYINRISEDDETN